MWCCDNVGGLAKHVTSHVLVSCNIPVVIFFTLPYFSASAEPAQILTIIMCISGVVVILLLVIFGGQIPEIAQNGLE